MWGFILTLPIKGSGGGGGGVRAHPILLDMLSTHLVEWDFFFFPFTPTLHAYRCSDDFLLIGRKEIVA